MVEENAGKNELIQVTLKQGQTIHIPQGVPSSAHTVTSLESLLACTSNMLAVHSLADMRTQSGPF